MRNNTKVILFDFDGVLLRPPLFFSQKLEQDGYKNAGYILGEYYTTGDELCNEGKADSKVEILPYLSRIGWESGVDDYLDQMFNYEKEYLDKNLMRLIVSLRSAGFKCFLCSDQEKERAKFIMDTMGLSKSFDGSFISCNLGYRKIHDKFWEKVLEIIRELVPDIQPSEIMYFDDASKNLTEAATFGIRATLFENYDQVKETVSL
jgi:FMN phosphatase YigB (HAD superfamily)